MLKCVLNASNRGSDLCRLFVDQRRPASISVGIDSAIGNKLVRVEGLEPYFPPEHHLGSNKDTARAISIGKNVVFTPSTTVDGWSLRSEHFGKSLLNLCLPLCLPTQPSFAGLQSTVRGRTHLRRSFHRPLHRETYLVKHLGAYHGETLL